MDIFTSLKMYLNKIKNKIKSKKSYYLVRIKCGDYVEVSNILYCTEIQAVAKILELNSKINCKDKGKKTLEIKEIEISDFKDLIFNNKLKDIE